jgi:hypothetical protein
VLQAFEDLPLRVNINDRLQVQDKSGAKVTGRVIRLASDEIMIQSSAGEKPLAYGGLAACVAGPRTECADAGIIGAGPRAGGGFVVGMLLHTTKVVYPEPERKQRSTRN